MTIIIAVLSIVVLTGLVHLAQKAFPFKICPVCAGVALTWAGLLTAHFLGYGVSLIVPALLMGGTVIGIMSQVEKRSANMPEGTLRLWKALFAPAGFIAMYAILEEAWTALLVALVFIALISLALLARGAPPSPGGASEVKKRLDDCC